MRNFSAAAALVSLKANLGALTWLQAAIPTEVGDSVGVGAGEVAVPAVGNPIAAGVVPAYAPATGGAGAGVGHCDAGGKTAVPLVGDFVQTTGLGIERHT